MSTDLLTQLAAYGADHEDRQEPVSADEILGAVVPIPVRVMQRSTARTAVVAVAAAAAVAIVVALPLLFGARSSQTPPAIEAPVVSSTVATTTLEASPTTSTATDAPIGASLEWREFDLDGTTDPLMFVMGELASGDYIALSNDGFSAGDCWHARTRSRTTCDPSNPPDGSVPFGEIPTVLLFSSDGTVTTAPIEGVDVVHENWTRSGALVLAAGTDEDDESLTEMIVTTDGLTWDRRPLPPDAQFGHSYGHGDFVAIGDTVVIWSSLFNRDQPVPVLASPGPGEPFEVVLDNEDVSLFTVYELGGELFALDNATSVYSSQDGLTWNLLGQATGLPVVDTPDSSPPWIGELDGRLVAWLPDPTGFWQVFESANGVTWSELQPTGATTDSINFGINQLAPNGWLSLSYDEWAGSGGIILTRDGVTWIEPPPNPRYDNRGAAGPWNFILQGDALLILANR